jgi:hypothetical protein
MNGSVPTRLRKAWHLLRRRLGAHSEPPRRLIVQKAKWLNAARSPVMLMIDDLTNAWHSRSGGDTWEPGGDWGGGLRRPNSMLRSLEEGLLQEFPAVKVTFFTVAGPISAYTDHQPFTYAKPLDVDDESRRFFRSLAENPRYELAYHGFNHGTAGRRSEEFVQEWQGFSSLDAAVTQTRQGLAVFERATGSVPKGGKYGGWAYNAFAEDAIDACGFSWWCRDWTPRDVSGTVAHGYYEPQFFGRSLVVSLPSTVHGFFWDPRQLDVLLDHQQVIAITEHIAPVRPDGRIQTPNIVDDMGELYRLFGYLKRKDVWYATGSEIAAYVVARERTLIYDVTREGFSVRYDGRSTQPELTLTVDCSALCTAAQPLIEVILPDSRIMDPSRCRFDPGRLRHLITVPIMEGRFQVRARPG